MKTLTQKISEARQVDEAKDNSIAELTKKFKLDKKSIELMIRRNKGAKSTITYTGQLKRGFLKKGDFIVYKDKNNNSVIISILSAEMKFINKFINGEDVGRLGNVTQVVKEVNSEALGDIALLSDDESRSYDAGESLHYINKALLNKVPEKLKPYIEDDYMDGDFQLSKVPPNLYGELNDFSKFVDKMKKRPAEIAKLKAKSTFDSLMKHERWFNQTLTQIYNVDFKAKFKQDKEGFVSIVGEDIAQDSPISSAMFKKLKYDSFQRIDLNAESGKVFIQPHVSYEHHGGGTNGCNLGKSNFVYNIKTNTLTVGK